MIKAAASFRIFGTASIEQLPTDPRRRLSVLRGGTALGGAALALLLMTPAPVRAADECGTPTDGAVNCTAANNPYNDGISYSATDDLTVNLASGVAVDTSGNDFTPGVSVSGYYSAVAVNTAADATVTTDGARSFGVRVYSYYGSATVAAQGDIATAGARADGVNAFGYGAAIDVTVGNVTTTGGYSAGVFVQNEHYDNTFARTFAIAADAPADPYASSVTVNGTVSTGALFSPGVYAHNDLGSQAVVVNGTISTLGEDSDGIVAFGASGVTISGAGSITTAGDYSDGINADGSNGDADVTIGSVTTTGYGAAGIVAHASGDVTVNVGDVSTSGGYSDGIRASADADGAVSVTSTGTISTTGNGSDGVYAISYGTGTIGVTVNNVTTTGDYSKGVYASNGAGAPSGDVSVKVTGAVSTGGIDATGIYAFNNYGSASVENDGSVTTSGDGATGIYAGAYVDATVSGRGSVTTTGADAIGIYANANQNVSVTAGAVSTSGAGATGIYAFGYYGNVTVDATSVATTGANAVGIQAATDTDGAGSVSVTAGTVSTQGAASDGIYAASHNGGDVTVNSTESVSTVTDGSIGIDAVGSGGAVNVSAVDVSTQGAYSDAIHASDGDGGPRLALATAASPDMAVTVTGDVSTVGDHSRGVYAVSYAGAVSVENDGSITTQGAYSTGIYAQARSGAAVTVTGTGSVSTAGLDAVGVLAFGGSADVTTGSVTTTGAGSAGIEALGVYGDSSVNAGSTATGGVNSAGIVALAAADATVGATSVTTTGDNSVGIYAIGGFSGFGIPAEGGGNVSVTAGTVATEGATSDGIYAKAASGGDVAVTSTGSVSTQGDASIGIDAVGTGGAVNVSAVDVSTQGTYSDAIRAINAPAEGEDIVMADALTAAVAPDMAVTVTGNVSTAGDRSVGVYAVNRLGAVSIENDGTVSTGGYASDGIEAIAATGDVAVSGAGSVATTGEYSYGVFALAYGSGNVSVTTGAVSTTGDYATGIGAFADDGDTTVNAASVTTNGYSARGIYAEAGSSGAGNVSVTAGNVATQGDESDAIYARAYSGGDVAVTSTGSVSTQGDTSVGIYAIGTGAINVAAVDVSTLGDDSDAIRLRNTAAGDEDVARPLALAAAASPDMAVTVTGNVSTAGDRSDGVDAVNTLGAISIENDGAITTEGASSTGIYAVSSAGAVTVSGTGTVTTNGDGSAGILAASFYGDTTVLGSGTVSTSGAYAPGIVAVSLFGNASATGGSVSTVGANSDGISAETFYGGDVSATSTGTVSTQGDNSVGIYAHGSGGAVNVHAVNVSTSGNSADAIQAINNAQGLGIDAVAAAPDMAVTVTGNVSTTGDNSIGIDAVNPVGAVTVENDGAVGTAGYGSAGIVAVSLGGDVTVSGTGAVSTTGDYATGIYAAGPASVSVTNGSVRTAGAYSDGVEAYSSGGTVTVDTGTVAVTGTASNGIYAYGPADVSVTAGATSAADGIAIAAISTGGATTVSVSGATTSASGDAIAAYGATGATVNVAAGGSVKGATDAIVIGSAAPDDAGGGAVEEQARSVHLVAGAPRLLAAAAGAGVGGTTVINAGTITGGSGYAVLASGGPALIDNSGTIDGRVSLTANDDQFDNSGTFATTGTSDFGAGTDSLVNSGTVKASGITTLANLESFTNAGTISLVNGTIGDQLEIGGDYVGANGRLALDVNFSGATPTGDLLTIDGDASGTTNVVLNGTQAPTLGTRLVVVNVAGSSPATAFTLAGGQTQQSGFVLYSIQYDPTLTNYYLTAVAGPGVFRGLKMNEAAQSLWYKTADAWSAHMLDISEVMRGNAPAPAGRVWGQLYGSVSKRSDGRVYTSGGITQNIDLSYRQDYYGGQIGIDLGSTGDNGGFVFGATGGYLSSALTFRGVADKVAYDDYNAGVYAGFTGGSFFVNGLAKYDYYNADAKSGSIGYRDKFHGHSYGAMGEAGFRFGSDSFHFDPVASIAYTRTDLGTLKALSSTIDFDQLDGLRGKAGARIGGSTPIAHGSTITYYAGGSVVKEFKGRDGIVFTSGLSTLPLRNDRIPTYGEVRAGVNIVSANGVTGFLEGNTDYSKDYKGYGGRVGLRVKF